MTQSLIFSGSPRCQVVPLPGKQVAFGIDGKERLRWHAAHDAPRPFFFPLTGPSGLPLTRMGHPGAPDHDHHRSIWFAHHKVMGIDFWSNNGESYVRQQQWLAYDDGEDDARMACKLGWYDGHNPAPLIEQELIVVLAPIANDEVTLEIQTSFVSVAKTLELEQTNFGFLAVRVAKSISAAFGDGVLTGANGKQSEKNLFGKANAWIDYSGSIKDGVTEGITYFDHAKNLTYPTKWHVRQDGWVGASVCRDAPVQLSRSEPMVWRYLLHAHAGVVNSDTANKIANKFNKSSALRVSAGKRAHQRKTVVRL